MQHYYSSTPQVNETKRVIHYQLNGETFELYSSSGVFSMQKIDYGTDFMLRTLVKEQPEIYGKGIDMGCGYGVIGVVLGTLFPKSSIEGVDVNQRAVELAARNANHLLNVSFQAVSKMLFLDPLTHSEEWLQFSPPYDFVVTNPPIRAGKQVVHAFFEAAHCLLGEGGRCYVVIQKKQGAASAQDKLMTLFGNCEIVSRSAGYRILKCVKYE